MQNGKATKAGQPTPENHRCRNPQNTGKNGKPTTRKFGQGRQNQPTEKTGGDNYGLFAATGFQQHNRAKLTQNKTAQRYGKGRAANESQAQPQTLIKTDVNCANGRRVTLTDLLAQ